MCHTAKAYFPDRQSCSTLCRQPSGCARSVEVVAVYPSLGSYSVVGLFWWASPPFKRLLILPSIMYGVGKRVFQGSNQYFVDLHKTGSWFLCSTTSRKFNPSLVTTGRRQNRTLIRKLFLSLLFCTNQVICFCAIFSFKKSPSLLPTGKRILLPHFEKKYFLLLFYRDIDVFVKK